MNTAKTRKLMSRTTSKLVWGRFDQGKAWAKRTLKAKVRKSVINALAIAGDTGASVLGLLDNQWKHSQAALNILDVWLDARR